MVMKYEISEERLFKLLDKIIISHYGEPIKMVVDPSTEKYLHFIKISDDEKKVSGSKRVPRMFERNSWGMLFINDRLLYKKIMLLLGITSSEASEIILRYFEYKFGTYFKKVYLDFTEDDNWDGDDDEN